MHVEHGSDRAEVEFAVEMRKQLVVARGLPAQRIAKRIGIDLDQEQPGLAEEMLLGGLRHLRGERKMDEAVPDVVGAAAVHALPLGLAPGRSGTDFVDPAHLFSKSWLSLLNSESFSNVSLGFPRGFPGPGGPYRRALRTSRVAFEPCATA